MVFMFALVKFISVYFVENLFVDSHVHMQSR